MQIQQSKIVTFRKPGFWSCTFWDFQVKESNLKRAEFNLSTFRNYEFRETTFKNSSLELIIAWDVKLRESNKYMEIKDSSNFANILKDMSSFNLDRLF